MCITPLSDISIKNGEVVSFPDFTRGKWADRKDAEDWKYNLDKITKNI